MLSGKRLKSSETHCSLVVAPAQGTRTMVLQLIGRSLRSCLHVLIPPTTRSAGQTSPNKDGSSDNSMHSVTAGGSAPCAPLVARCALGGEGLSAVSDVATDGKMSYRLATARLLAQILVRNSA
eukprot:2709086-Rhodomonas_salina.2